MSFHRPYVLHDYPKAADESSNDDYARPWRDFFREVFDYETREILFSGFFALFVFQWWGYITGLPGSVDVVAYMMKGIAS